LIQVEKTTGKKPDLLVQPEFSKELGYIWGWYLDMRSGEVLTFTEIKNWSELTQQKLLAWEVDLIRTIDRVYWSCVNG
jgi:hypothetical protein